MVSACVDPVPVVLMPRNAAATEVVRVFLRDQRIELFVAEQFSRSAVSFANRVAGVIVASVSDPLGALLHAVSAGVRVPLVLAAPRISDAQFVELEEAGASAILPLPPDRPDKERVLKLLARQDAIARVDPTLRVLLDPVARVVRKGQRAVELTQREFALLQCLSSHRGNPVSTDDLRAYVWGDQVLAAETSTIVGVYVFHLRRKLTLLGLNGAITTARGFGYGLAPPAADLR